MATLSSISAWRIPQTEEPGGLQFLRWQRVRHDLTTKQHTSARGCTATLATLPRIPLIPFPRPTAISPQSVERDNVHQVSLPGIH